MRNLLFVLFGVLLLAACAKQDLPSDGNGDPVFSVSFIASGDTSTNTITAGVGDYYLFTRFESDSQGILYTGAFAPAICPAGDCARSLSFEFRNTNLDTSFPSDNFFYEGLHEFAAVDSVSSTSYVAAFHPINDAFVYDSFTWSFNGSPDQNNGLDDITVSFQDTINPISVKLTAYAADGQSSAVQRFISANGTPNLYPGVDILLQYENDTTGYDLTALLSGPGTQTVSWSTGSNQSQINIVDLTQNPVYSVSVSDASPYSASATLGNLLTGIQVTRTANFDYSVSPITTTTEIKAGELAIQWIDRQGLIWRSDRGQQSPDAVFQVFETEGYQLNENGQKTRKMRVGFDCLLFNAAGESMTFSGEGVIGVAYP